MWEPISLLPSLMLFSHTPVSSVERTAPEKPAASDLEGQGASLIMSQHFQTLGQINWLLRGLDSGVRGIRGNGSRREV